MLKPIFLLLPMVLFVSCAGPADPFGAIDDYVPVVELPQLPKVDKSKQNSAPEISFFPSHQISHKSHTFKVLIEDPKGIGRNHQVKVRYNDHYISEAWLERAKKTLSPDGKSLTVDFGILRFMPDKDNFIIATYQRDDKSGIVAKEYTVPKCKMSDYQIVRNYNEFSEHTLTLQKIERIARRYNVNPSLFSALIAQESSFDPKAVSWAKAVGLTQVTTIASEQIENKTKEWPRHRGIASMSVPTLKWFISSEKINEGNEWRLDEELSIKGGIEFMQYLEYYWQKEENAELLSATFEENTPWTDVLLASYNSGAYNVKKSIKQNGKDWLKARHLKEARKYVGKINSYCYAFSEI